MSTSPTGRSITFAPEDPARRVTVTSGGAPIGLYDGRNQAQNGWFVLRGLLPAGRTGRVLLTSGAAPDHPVHPFLPESAYLKAQVYALD